MQNLYWPLTWAEMFSLKDSVLADALRRALPMLPLLPPWPQLANLVLCGKIRRSGGRKYQGEPPTDKYRRGAAARHLIHAPQKKLHILWDNLWKSRGGIVVNGSPREVPKSTQWSP